ncbi:helix-turn-helix domain-containing protein [Actinomadura macra]|uniref:helix-turn-helix domain-containing protein n=1 Tax=Actinomadura macra TaxID=46164 RepID=UPI000A0062D8|nr:helix-turn-helix transcriptional regulator [Actinomadura macra]
MASSKVGSIGEYIREQRTRAKISLRQLADVSGISNPYLSQIERGLRKPSVEILQQIAKGLRISAEALYVQAGILEDREADTDVMAAVRADLVLTERQKQVLLDIYASFLKENEAIGVLPEEDAAPERTASERTGSGRDGSGRDGSGRDGFGPDGSERDRQDGKEEVE